MTAHWGIADPAAVEGSDAEKAFAFRRALHELESRIKLFSSLPIESLDRMTLQARLREIGTSFANPAITIGRALSNTFAGIAPSNAPAFIASQLCGALVGLLLGRWLLS